MEDLLVKKFNEKVTLTTNDVDKLMQVKAAFEYITKMPIMASRFVNKINLFFTGGN